MLIVPRATEKAYFEQMRRTYIFDLKDGSASKQEVKKAVEEQYKVTVESVRVLTRKGKKTRFSRGKHAYPGTTFRADKKIAYVTLKEGDKIAVFKETAETEAIKEAKSDKKDNKKEGDK